MTGHRKADVALGLGGAEGAERRDVALGLKGLGGVVVNKLNKGKPKSGHFLVHTILSITRYSV